MLVTPGRWVADTVMSKYATKNHRQQSRCITKVSLDEPILMATTRLKLSHRKLTCCLDSCGPQTMQLKIIGTNSLAMMLEFDHSGGHCHCNHCVLNTAPQPHEPEASVCIDKSEVVLSAGWCNMLSPFHNCRKVCHHIKSDLNSLFSLVRKCIFWSLGAF